MIIFPRPRPGPQRPRKPLLHTLITPSDLTPPLVCICECHPRTPHAPFDPLTARSPRCGKLTCSKGRRPRRGTQIVGSLQTGLGSHETMIMSHCSPQPTQPSRPWRGNSRHTGCLRRRAAQANWPLKPLIGRNVAVVGHFFGQSPTAVCLCNSGTLSYGCRSAAYQRHNV